jgi:energy-coupling factor transporter ATP-binding protein EcfA2
MVTVTRKIRIPDEATVEIDLRQEQNVEAILRKLSRYGAIAIENATSVLPHHSSEITTNEVRRAIFTRRNC